jgi:hypothetical protein
VADGRNSIRPLAACVMPSSLSGAPLQRPGEIFAHGGAAVRPFPGRMEKRRKRDVRRRESYQRAPPRTDAHNKLGRFRIFVISSAALERGRRQQQQPACWWRHQAKSLRPITPPQRKRRLSHAYSLSCHECFSQSGERSRAQIRHQIDPKVFTLKINLMHFEAVHHF